MAKKTQQKRMVNSGRVYISASFNNTIITLTDDSGVPFMISSCGQHGFAGTRKSTPYAATVTVQTTLQKASTDHGFKAANVYIKGIGPGREASLRAIKAVGLSVNKVLDITPIPHNGVRPPKPKRG